MYETSDPLTDSAAVLSRLLLEEETLGSVLQRVVELACTTVPGCDHAGVTLMSDNRVGTAAATDETTLRLDATQYATGEGPCLETIRAEHRHVIDDTDGDTQFPAFSREAREAGVRSVVSHPLTVRGKTLGALNLYADGSRAIDEAGRDLAARYASQAAVAMANAQVHDRTVTLVTQLNEALESRTVIEQAKGILMARQGIDDTQAFNILRKASQNRNRKLREIAGEIVAAVTAPGKATGAGSPTAPSGSSAQSSSDPSSSGQSSSTQPQASRSAAR